MASCKDCMHEEVCNIFLDCLNEYDAEKCVYFKDRNRFVELPCKVGDTVYELDIFTDYEKCHRCDYYYAGGMGDSPECEKGRYGQRAR